MADKKPAVSRKPKIDKIEKILWEMIMAGGGNGETIRRYARRIAQIKD